MIKLHSNVLAEHVQHVKDFLLEKNLDVPFFIAGGSVFSIINGRTEYDDIDVYFYDAGTAKKVQNAFEKSASFQTSNSLSFSNKRNEAQVTFENEVSEVSTIIAKPEAEDPNKLHWEHDTKLQFVLINSGNPFEVFSRFEFCCCRCCFTSDLKYIYDDTYSTSITADIDNCSGDILKRYRKYIDVKGATDENQKTRIKIYNSLARNLDKKMKNYYGGESADGYTILNGELHDLKTHDDLKTIQILHDIIAQCNPENKLYDIFKKLSCIHFVEIQNPCDELVLIRLKWPEDVDDFLFLSKHSLNIIGNHKKDEKRIQMKYPEYFI